MAGRKNGTLADEGNAPSARQKLLAAGIDLFTTRGYSATSVREIVERAGLTKPALYYHFGSKDGIYLAILQEIERTFAATLADVDTLHGTLREKVERLFLMLFDLFEQNLSAVRFLTAVFWGPPGGAPRYDLETTHRRLVLFVQQLVADSVPDGAMTPAAAHDSALALIGIFSLTVDLEMAHPEWGVGREGLIRLLGLLFEGLDQTSFKENIS